MTSAIERLVAIIAPHHCIICGIENNMLCQACSIQLAEEVNSICFLCRIQTPDGQVCYACRSDTVIEYVWCSGEFTGPLAYLIKQLKFGRAQAAAPELAKHVALQLPQLSPTTLVVPVPTASSRIRQRGYDQSKLLAKELAGLRSLTYQPLLGRRSSTRQVGASRQQRMRQAKQAFYVLTPEQCRGKDILLVDDVVTSGATLSATAQLLREAGAVSVNAAVVARQRLK